LIYCNSPAPCNVQEFVKDVYLGANLMRKTVATALVVASFWAVDANAGSFTTIDVPGANNTVAYGINDKGQIVGGYYGDTTGSGFLDKSGSFTPINFPGAPNVTYAYGINDKGQIVGIYADSAGDSGFLYSNGTFTTINVPGALAGSTSANGINDKGQIVGYYSDSAGVHGFLDKAGSFTPINVPGATYTYANGINDNGQIVGYYANNGVASGFLYDPAPGPIPGSGLLSYVALAMLGLVSAGWKRWRLRSA
jgi:probable HAF family extracellular repeat protein